MRSSWTSRLAARHVAVLGLVVAVGAGPLATVATTSATFTSTATGTGSVATAPACVGDVRGYTSGRLDAAHPLLRWSFSDGVPVVGPAPVAHTPGATTTPVATQATTSDAIADPATVDGVTADGATPAGSPSPTTPAPVAEAGAAPASPDRADQSPADPASPATTHGADVTPAGPPSPSATGSADAAPAHPAPAAAGLLVCDPLDLAAGGQADPAAARSLDLVGGTGSGLSSAAPVTGAGPVTLLLWVRVAAGAPDGELASLGAAPVAATGATRTGDHGTGTAVGTGTGTDTAEPTDTPEPTGTVTGTADLTQAADTADVDAAAAAPPTLVLSVVGDSLRATDVLDGASSEVATVGLTRDTAHLVAVTVGGDGDAPTVSVTIDAEPAGAPVALTRPLTPASLTVGARPGATSAVARVDEVTLLPAALPPIDRQALVTADRWWAPRAG